MISTDQKFLLQGSSIVLNWELKPTRKQLYLWVPESIWFWKNYTRIPYNGHTSLILSGNTFKVKIKQLSFINLETIETFSAPIHKVDIKNLETEIGVTKGASYPNHREFNADLGKFGFYEKNKSMHKRTRRLIKNSTLFKLNSIKYELDVLYSKFNPTSKTK